MCKYLKEKPSVLLLLLVGLWTLLNLVTAVANDMSGTEAYLWYAARQLDWGYADLSPLTVFFAWLGVNFAGSNELGVRLFFVLIQGVALYTFCRVTCRSALTSRGVLLYFLVTFSLPLLQIYGLFASTEIAFLFATVLCLWAFDGYLSHEGWQRQGFLGLSFALLLASCSAGIFVVLALIVSQPRTLFSWRFALALFVAAVLLSPLVWWQINSGWPILSDFMPLTTSGGWGAVSRTVITLLAWFNPFLLVPFLVLITRRGGGEPMERTMRILFWIFLTIILVAAIRGAELGVWITPVALSVIYVLVSGAMRRKGLRRYLLVFCSLTGIAFVLLRAMIVIQPAMASKLELDDNSLVARATADTLGKLGVQTLVLQDDAQNASIMNHYTNMPTIAVGSIYGSPNVYDTRSAWARLAGRQVAVEISTHARKATAPDSLAQLYTRVELGAPQREAYLMLVCDYHSLRDVRIEVETLPRKVLTASRIALLLKITNPYPYDIELGPEKGVVLNIYLSHLPLGESTPVHIPFKSQTLFANTTINIASTITIPTLETGQYLLSIVLERYPMLVGCNSETFTISIVNPKSRI